MGFHFPHPGDFPLCLEVQENFEFCSEAQWQSLHFNWCIATAHRISGVWDIIALY